jgi:competence protein ComGC
MKLGFSEIFLVILIIGVILIASVFSPSRAKKEREELLSREPRNEVEARDQDILRKRRSGFNIASLVMVILGLLLILGAPGLIKAVIWSYAGGAAVIIIGLIIFFITRRS